MDPAVITKKLAMLHTGSLERAGQESRLSGSEVHPGQPLLPIYP
jgi:hypothetical protein